MARDSLRRRLWSLDPLESDLQPDDPLSVHAGAFVTLRQGGRLRGCIGQTESVQPLFDTIVDMAVAAGTRDPRFSPVTAVDLDSLCFEISVLGPLEACGIEQVRVGRDGLVVVDKDRRGLLLPEVAIEQGWSGSQFVKHTCGKAGLPHDAVPLMADLYRFQTQHFVEDEGC